MNKTFGVTLRIAGLALLWLLVAIGAPVAFGHALNAHSDFGLVAALAAALAGLAALAFIGLKIVETIRAL